MKRTFILLSILISITAANVSAQERYVLPVDEGSKNASFAEFREKLIDAVKRKDKNYLVSVLDTDIAVSFGGDQGIDDFKEFWKLDNLKSKIWDELHLVLSNGGRFSDGAANKQFCAPYSFSAFPDDLDAFEYSVVFGSNVRLRSRPGVTSKIITQLSYNVVSIDIENSVSDNKETPTFSWFKVKTLGGKSGFISADYVRSPIDYRACFEKKQGSWKMTVFIAGD